MLSLAVPGAGELHTGRGFQVPQDQLIWPGGAQAPVGRNRPSVPSCLAVRWARRRSQTTVN